MTNPLFWLVLSLLFVTASLTILLVVMIPTLKELGRAARSAEKLFETLRREFPPTLEAIRLTGMEISDLTDDISDGVQSAGQVAKQVDQTLTGARKQARKVQLSTRSLISGVKTAWKTFTHQQPPQRRLDRLPSGRTSADQMLDSEMLDNEVLNSEILDSEMQSASADQAQYRPKDANGTRFISKAGELVEETQLPVVDLTEAIEEREPRGRSES